MLLWIFFALFILYTVRHFLAYSKLKHIPGIRQFAFRGLAQVPFLWPHFYLNNFEAVYKYFKSNQAPRLFKITGGADSEIYICGAEEMRKISTTKANLFPKPVDPYIPLSVFGENIVSVSTNGMQWRQHRVLCNPAFGHRHLEFMIYKTVDTMKLAFEQVLTPNKVHTLAVERVLLDITLDVFGKAAFGTDLGVYNPSAAVFDPSKHKMSFREALAHAGSKWTMAAYYLLPRFMASSKLLFPKINTGLEEVNLYLDELIAAGTNANDTHRVDLLTLLTRLNEEEILASPTSPQVFDEDKKLDLEVSASVTKRIKLTQQEIKSDIFIFLLAGHETTATELQWTLFELAKNQEAQNKLRKQIIEVMQDNVDPTYFTVTKLKCVYNVVYESLRLHPPITMIPKITTQEVEIAGYTIPKDTNVVLAMNAIQRDPIFWENPDEFKPERFEDPKKVNPHAFVSFSAGYRKCIGMNFALMESVTILAMLLTKFSVHFTDDVNPQTYDPLIITEITSKPIDLKLVFRPLAK